MSADGQTALFKSRILIKMPIGLTEWDKATGPQAQLQVKVLSMEKGSMINPDITLITDPINEDCGKGQTTVFGTPLPDRVCYSIEPQEKDAIQAGEMILRIFSTVN